MKNRQLLDNDHVGRLLLKLSLPAMVGMMVMSLYNIVDTIFVGKGVGTQAIGALSIAFPLQTLIMGISQMIGMGAASLLSRSLGEGAHEKAGKTVGNAFALALGIGLTLTVLGHLFLNPLLRAFGATDTLVGLSRIYVNIVLWGVPLQALSMTMNNLVRAEGKAQVAMATMLIGALSNIALDALFILHFQWGVAGAAWATVASQGLTTLFLVHFFYSGKAVVHPRWSHWRLDGAILKEIFGIGVAVFARHSAMSLLAMVMNRTLPHFGGDLAIAVYGILFRVLMFVFMPLMGIAQGMQPIAGFNYGARRLDRLRRTLRLSMTAATLSSVAGTAVLALFPEAIFRLFSHDAVLLEMGRDALRWVILAFPLVGFQVVGSTLFQAIGKAVPNFFLSLSRQILFFLPLVLVLPRFFQLQGVWMAFPSPTGFRPFSQGYFFCGFKESGGGLPMRGGGHDGAPDGWAAGGMHSPACGGLF